MHMTGRNSVLELFAEDWRDLWLGAATPESVGAVFTKPAIVDLILDISGYVASKKRLAEYSLLEPSCGDGAFLTAVVRRLLESELAQQGAVDWSEPLLASAIRAVDINSESVAEARRHVTELLIQAGCSTITSRKLASGWIVQTDFLLQEWPGSFDFVMGNPPYVRIEDVPKRVLTRYRERFATTTDRADLYVAFLERGLELLSPKGTLAFICANRFTKNQYGETLRRLLAKKYHVRHYINLEHTQPFLADVSAYPAIIVIDRAQGYPTRAVTLDDIEPCTLKAVRTEILAKKKPGGRVSEFATWYPNGDPWITTSGAEHSLLDQLNDTLPLLEESSPGTKVSIGVATGADNVYVLKGKHTEIEESRQIPLLMAADVRNDMLKWSGHFLVNPFADEDDGTLVTLADYPGLAAHLAANDDQLRKRHVAKTRPKNWFRTIDRIWPTLQSRPKLVIRDIQSSTVIGFDIGLYYPHHNLYWITSDTWPLLALKALLRSHSVYQQVKAYSVQMRGGSVRFQAQTLRRLRVPYLRQLPAKVVSRLVELAMSDDQGAIDEAAREAYSYF